jgi:uncharacterized protein YukE
MSKITRVDIPSVTTTLGNLDGITDRFETAVATMKRVASELDGCWGDDEFGQKFAANYLKYADETLDNSDITVGTLRDLETNLRQIVKMFQELDSESGGVLELIDT